MSDSDNTQKYVDMALQEAVSISYAVPEVGPAIGALFSGIQAIYDLASSKPTQISNYSVEVAFEDLARDFDKKLTEKELKDKMSVISACHDAGDADKSTLLRALTDSHYWDDEDALKKLEDEVSGLHDDITNAKLEIIDIFNWFEARTGAEMVASLDAYLIARHNFHRMCISKLKLQALILQRQAMNRGETMELPEYYDTHHDLIDDLYKSLSKAISFAGPKMKHLQDIYSNRVANARKESVKQVSKPGLARQQAFFKALRQINEDAHTDKITEETVGKLAKLLDAFRISQAGLEHKTAEAIATEKNKPAKDGGYNPLASSDTPHSDKAYNPLHQASQPAAAPVVKLKSGSISFLFESNASGGYVDVLQDSPVCAGYIATQNAGSSNKGMYYTVDGGTLNGFFKAALARATQLKSVNAALQLAYDEHYGNGEYAKDEHSGRQDRLTSLIVPLRNNIPGCVGEHVIAMIYSVGPQLGSAGITDEPGYQQIYTDALNQVAMWNNRFPKAQIMGIRLTMLSNGAYSGGSEEKVLARKSADLILAGIVAAVNIHPALGQVTMIINCKGDNNNSRERDAFMSAAKQRQAVTNNAGFDLTE